MIDIKGITKSFGSLQVLKGIDLHINKGEVVSIVGPSGAGKTTLLQIMGTLDKPDGGTVVVDGIDVGSLSAKKLSDFRNRHIGFVFQFHQLLPEFTALENVMIKNNLTNFKPVDEIKDWFERLGIGDKLNAKVGRMSFGQQQRVAMMRALVQPFDFILADEPISHLDDTNSAIMADIMMTEAKRQGAGVIVTSIGKHMELDYDKVYKL